MATLVLLLMMLPALTWKGYVASVLWGWFAVPVGLPAIGTGVMMGAALFNDLMFRHFPPDSRPIDAAFVYDAVGRAIFLPAFFLGIGWIVKTWFIQCEWLGALCR